MRSAGAPTDLRRVFENLEDTFRGMRDISDVVIAVAYDTS
jgi:hypothetical protein